MIIGGPKENHHPMKNRCMDDELGAYGSAWESHHPFKRDGWIVSHHPVKWDGWVVSHRWVLLGRNHHPCTLVHHHHMGHLLNLTA